MRCLHILLKKPGGKNVFHDLLKGQFGGLKEKGLAGIFIAADHGQNA